MRTDKKKYFSRILMMLALPVLFFGNSVFAAWNSSELMAYGLPSASIYRIIRGILDWLLMIVGFLGVIAFAIAGILYLVSAGNDDMIKKAKAAMKYAIIGVIVALAGMVALRAAYAILSGGFFNNI